MIDKKIKKYFWDADFELLNPEENKKYILERILEMGDENAVNWAFKTYSKKDILETIKNNRKISKKSFNFWNFVLNR